MPASATAAPEGSVRRRDFAAPEDTDATVLLLLTRDTALASALLEGTFPDAIRLHLVRSPSAALSFLTQHSPDAFVLDASIDLTGGARHAAELAFRLRSRSVPLVMVSPAGHAAQSFLELCRVRSVDATFTDDRTAAALGTLVRSGIERRRRRLRFAYVLAPLARLGRS